MQRKRRPFFRTRLSLLVSTLGLALMPAPLLRAAPVISEFLASNPGTDTDAFGESSDWIEIHNPDATAVNLGGWSLTDNPDQPKKWVFPDISLTPQQFLVVRASGKNLADPSAELHTGFRLKASGGSLALYPPQGGPAASAWENYPKQFAGYSYGKPAGGNGPAVWFSTPTPGEANASAGLTDYVRDTHFSLPRGFLDAPATVTVTVDTPGAEIRHTLDGSEPGPASPLLTAPLPLSTTTVLRVRGFKAGLVPSNTDTRTWIFPSSWISQPDNPPGFPVTWGNPLRNGQLNSSLGVLADYGMDAGVTNDPGIRSALTETLPVVCLTGQVDDLFGMDGINGNGRRGDTEKPVAVEYFNPADPADRFSTRATLQAHGGGVREFAKKAYRLDFSGTEADGALHHPLFPGGSHEVFDQLVLRSGGHDSFTVSPAAGLSSLDPYDLAGHGTYIRDQFLRRTENEMGLLSPRGRYVHLCLNGLYWGLYDLHERPNARYAAGYEGGAEEDWDVVHHAQSGTGQQVVDGDDAAWNDLQALASSLSTPADIAALKALIGPDNLIDHLLVRIWAGDFDWLGPAYMPGVDGVNPTGNIAFYQNKNWYALHRTRGAAGAAPWLFFTWDAEISMGNHLLRNWAGASTLPDNFTWPVSQRQLEFDFTGISRPNTPAAPWAALLQDPEFRLHAADRMRRLYYNQGALSPANAQARLASMIQELDAPILAESARWGDVSGLSITPLPGGGLASGWKNQRITRAQHWRPETEWLRGAFAAQRAGIVIRQFRARGFYPQVEPGDIAPFGGALGAEDKITLTTPEPAATLYYTTDGSDPRVSVTGAISPTATAASGPVTPPGNLSFLLKTRVLKDGVWSALTEARFTSAVPPAAAALAISEIHYHPADPTPQETTAGFTDADQFEFLEITNRSAQTVALNSLRFAAGIDFDFATGSQVHELAPGASLVLASDRGAFALRYGFEPAGVFASGTRLANNGEQIKLVTASGAVIADIAWQDNGDWPKAADGGGKSLTLLAPASGSGGTTASQWRAAAPTPGAVVETLTFADWRSDFFSTDELADPSISGPQADPDHDGLPNLLEYLTVSHPRRASPAPLTVVTLPEPGKIRFEWPVRPGTAASSVLLQLSPDLQTWSASLTAPTSLPTTQGVVLMQVDPALSSSHGFARLTGNIVAP